MTESQIIYIKKNINESLSSKVYHFTGIRPLYGMLEDNAIRLYSKFVRSSEDEYSEKLFYLSLTRNKDGRQGFSAGHNVRIEFDGDTLNNNFSGKAINYWGKRMGKNAYMSRKIGVTNGEIPYIQTCTENEDRLFSDKPVIRNIGRYITRIDILLGYNVDEQMAFSLSEMAKLNYHIPVYVYDNEENFNVQNNEYLKDDDILNTKYQGGAKYCNNDRFALYMKNQAVLNLLRNLIVVICYGEFKYDDKRLPSFISDMLNKYNLGQYVGVIINEVTKELSNLRYESDINYMINFYLNELYASDIDSNLHERIMGILYSYCKNYNITNREQLIAYKNDLNSRKKINESIALNSNKVRVVAKYLDDTFTKGAVPTLDDDGYPSKLSIVAMKGIDGKPIKYLTDKQLFYLLQDKFRHIIANEEERDKFLKHVMIEWYNGNIGKYGLTSKNLI